ncbi:hypothetical protein LTR37_011702 [Vermiconidia calcicola]|uniref:Uncharacterized protein n=1 Tax=Vermiconidia calcicola TaxID=1690605 RepID=A0ACC3N1P4_9PEZI|nr:hypothetical protein LTR37_011702 [Vermiconidia calcicola]
MEKKQRTKSVKANGRGHVDAVALASESALDVVAEIQEDKRSTFFRFPREVRDQIYEELLVARMKPKDQIEYDELKMATNTPFGDFGRDNAMDYFEQDICIMPGSDKKYPFVADAIGLLLTNKQIHEEANNILFSKNTFLILVEWERIHPFWRCENPGCKPPGRPCFIMFHNFKKVKHLYIIVRNVRALTDPHLKVESARLEANLKTVSQCFLQAGNKLKTLKIRYTSCFDGQIDAVRGEVEGDLPEGMPDRPILIKDTHGKHYSFERGEAKAYFFKHITVLEPLRRLKGIADDVKIRGDLPQAYMDGLVKVLSAPTPPPAIKKKQMEAEVARKRREESRKGNDFHSFMKELADGYEGSDPGMADYCRGMLKTSVMSPAVMADMMKPPTARELERICRRSQEASESEEEEEDVTDGEDIGVISGAIGVLDGKPVFGPPRPSAAQ